MSKYTKIPSNLEINSYLRSRISERNVLVKILFKTLQIILLNKNYKYGEDEIWEERYGDIYYYKSPKKTNRIIYILKDESQVYQAVSIVTPFRLVKKNEEYYFKLDLHNYNRDVFYFDYTCLQFYIEVIENGWMHKKLEKTPDSIFNLGDESTKFDIANFFDYLSDKCINFKKELNNDYDDIHDQTLAMDNTWKIIRYIMMYELGYFRYDYDNSERTDEKFHPLHHFDINYSEVGTYKIGINPNKLDNNWIIDLIARLISESDEAERHYLK